jgi:hypothetical protein
MMAFVPIVLGIKPSYPTKGCDEVEIIYRSDNYRMRLDYIQEKDAQREIEKHGMIWKAYQWRYMDRLSDWEYVK